MRGTGYGSGRVFVSTDSTLYALDAATGGVDWSRSVWPGRDPPSVETGTVVAGDTAYIGVAGYGSAVYALDVANGAVRWSKDFYAVRGVAVGGDRLFVNGGVSVAALRRSDGGQLWGPRRPPISSTGNEGAAPPGRPVVRLRRPVASSCVTTFRQSLGVLRSER